MRKPLIAALFTTGLFATGVFATAATPVAASAQANLEGRVGKLESEMRAVQRKVFPGGSQVILPEVEAQAPQPGPAPGTPASNAVVDLTARVASLESQLATLTGQAEQNQFQIRRLQEQFDAYKRSNDARVKAVEAPVPAARTPDAAPADEGDRLPPSPRVSTRPATAAPATPAAPARGTSAEPGRAERLAAVAKPSTGDAPEDEYLYGYRLWAAKLYPEAEAQLKKVAADYPKHRRASYARNLLGRAYLDEGKPSLASVTFYDNYKALPDGERAPESLFYLAQALQALKKPADACKVYGELTDVYAAKIGAGMKADIAKGRAAAKCE